MATTIVGREITLIHDAKDAAAKAASSFMSEDEFRAFYERNSRSLWCYLSRIAGDRNAADDLLQEAFYRFYRAGAEHENESHRRHSLFRIATNLARDAHRRRGGVVSTPLDEADGGVEDDSVERRTDLTRALEKLDPRQREMLWLAYANGSSHEEIAEVVGVAPGSVKGLLLRARRKLAGILEAGRTLTRRGQR